MNRLPARFIEDRDLRDKARAVLAEDIDRVRGALEEEGIGSRVSSGVTATISSRIKSGARDVLEQAKEQAGDRKGVLALLIGAIILWFAREPLFSWFQDLVADGDESDEDPSPEAAPPATASHGDPE